MYYKSDTLFTLLNIKFYAQSSDIHIEVNFGNTYQWRESSDIHIEVNFRDTYQWRE